MYENRIFKREAFIKVTCRRFRDKWSETRATEEVLFFNNFSLHLHIPNINKNHFLFISAFKINQKLKSF
jgi:hypothetical protein